MCPRSEHLNICPRSHGNPGFLRPNPTVFLGTCRADISRETNWNVFLQRREPGRGPSWMLTWDKGQRLASGRSCPTCSERGVFLWSVREFGGKQSRVSYDGSTESSGTQGMGFCLLNLHPESTLRTRLGFWLLASQGLSLRAVSSNEQKLYMPFGRQTMDDLFFLLIGLLSSSVFLIYFSFISCCFANSILYIFSVYLVPVDPFVCIPKMAQGIQVPVKNNYCAR